MRPLKLAVDLDGILVNWVHGFLAYYNSLHRTTENFEPSSWDFMKELPRPEFQQAITTFYQVELFWQRLPAYVKNCDAMRDFLADRPNVNVTYLTARPSPSTGPSALVQTNRWLRAQNLLPDSANVLVVNHWKSKVVVASQVGFDAVIDDHHETVREMWDEGVDINATLLNRPWNQGVDLPRVPDLKTFLDSLK
jgi:hypothetical protein